MRAKHPPQPHRIRRRRLATAGALACLLALAAAAWGCDDGDEVGEAQRAPVVRAVRPERAPGGAPITLLGVRFGLPGPRDAVFLAGTPLAVESWTDAAVLVRLPAGAGPGVFDLVVRSGGYTSAPFAYEVLSPDRPEAGPGPGDGSDAEAE